MATQRVPIWGGISTTESCNLTCLLYPLDHRITFNWFQFHPDVEQGSSLSRPAFCVAELYLRALPEMFFVEASAVVYAAPARSFRSGIVPPI